MKVVMANRVLVTGITGFLGGHVALALLRHGFTVRGTLRDGKRAERVRATLAAHGVNPAAIEFAELDLTEDEGWAAAMEGVRFVQHVASPFVIDMPKDPAGLIRPAVEGTRRVLRSALNADVERVVLTSSMATIMYGHGRRREPFTAADWTQLENPVVNSYARSKTLAERAAWDVAQAGGATERLVAINPASIYGPLLDDDPGTSALIFIRMLRGEMPGVPPMILPAVDVRDVAEVQVAAMTAPAVGGHRIPLSAGSISLQEMATALAEAFPAFAARLPKRQLPLWFVRLYALFDKQTRDNLGELVPERTILADRARSLLGRDFISPRQAAIAMARSVIDQRLVTAG